MPSRVQLDLTSGAVTGVPSEKRAPSRSLTIQVWPSASSRHDSARPGTNRPVQSARISVSYSWRNSSRSLSFVGWGAFDESMRSVRATVATGSPGAPISAQLLVPGSGPMIVAAGGDTGGSDVTPAVVGGAGGRSARVTVGRRRGYCASCTPASSPEGRRRTQTPRILGPSASRLLFMIAITCVRMSGFRQTAGPHCRLASRRPPIRAAEKRSQRPDD